MAVRDRNEADPFILGVLLAGIFPGFGMNIYLAMHTFIYIDTLFHYWFLAGLGAMGIYLLIHRGFKRYRAEVVAYCFLGWASLLLAVFLSLNYFFHGEEELSVYHRVDNDKRPGASLGEIMVIQDSAYKDFPYLLHFEETEGVIVNDIKEIRVTTATGMFGYRVLLDKDIVY